MDLMKISLFFLLLALSSALLHPAEHTAASDNMVRVATTMTQLKPLVKAVGGSRVDVFSLIPAGADPHHYEPSLKEFERVFEAKLLVATGPSHLPIEARVLEEYAESGVGLLVDYRNYTRSGLRLLTLPDGKVNPHGYFLSYQGARAIASSVCRALRLIDPDHSNYYNTRLEAYLEWAESVYRSAREAVGEGLRAALITPTLHYTLDELGVKLVAVLVREHGVEPTVKDLESFLAAVGSEVPVLVADFEAVGYHRLLSLLSENGVKYTVIPMVHTFTQRPELTPILVAEGLAKGGGAVYEAKAAGFRWSETALPASITLNLVLAAILYMMYVRLRRGLR